LAVKKPFFYGDTFFQRIRLRESWVHKLVMWRALRHDFLFPHDEAPNPTHSHCPIRGFVPSLFSFKAYLNVRMGRNVAELVEISSSTWIITIVFVVSFALTFKGLPFTSVELVLCGVAWALFLAALVLTWLLEEDTFRITPRVPEDARATLQLFCGTSDLLMRQKTEGKFLGCPGLGDYDSFKQRPVLEPAPESGKAGILSSETYTKLVQLITFWQALVITALLISYLSRPMETWQEVALYALAWAEWPAMILYVVPRMIRRLTIRSSIGEETCQLAVRQVSLDAKGSLLRYYVRLIQIVAYVSHRAKHGESWAISPGTGWTRDQARAAWKRGKRLFNTLPHNQKQGIWHIFETWDMNNDGSVQADEIAKNLSKLISANLGCSDNILGERDPEVVAAALIRLVDYDGTGCMCWDKCQAVAALAFSKKTEKDVKEETDAFYQIVDKDGDGSITVFELTEWLTKIHQGMREEDIASLLYLHFDSSKPKLTKAEFHEWIVSLMQSSPAEPAAHGHGN